MQEIIIYKSPWKAIRVFLLCAPFVIIGVWMIRSADNNLDYFMGWFGTLFFGMGIPIAIWSLLDRRPQMIINEIGIFNRNTHKDFINWEVILDAYPTSVSGQKFICLVLDEDFKPSKKKGKWGTLMAKWNEDLGFQEINISLGIINIDEIKLTLFIQQMCSAKPAERKQLLLVQDVLKKK